MEAIRHYSDRISKTSVQRLLKQQDIQLRHQGLSTDQLRNAIQLYETDRSAVQVARTLHLSPSSVYDALKRSGVQLRSRLIRNK